MESQRWLGRFCWRPENFSPASGLLSSPSLFQPPATFQGRYSGNPTLMKQSEHQIDENLLPNLGQLGLLLNVHQLYEEKLAHAG